jgi:twitching motility protein PilT
MVTASHLACGPVTAMRSLTSALPCHRYQEDASRPLPGGCGCRDGDDRRSPDGRQRGLAARHEAFAGPAGPPAPDRAVRSRGRPRVRPGGPGAFRGRPARAIQTVQAGGGCARRSPGSAPPGVARARPAVRARRRAFLPAAGESDQRVHPGRPDRRAERRARPRPARRPAHPGDPAHRRPRPGRPPAGRPARRAGPGPAATGPDRTPATASRLPARDEPAESRPDTVRTGWHTGTAPRSPAPAGGAATRPAHAGAAHARAAHAGPPGHAASRAGHAAPRARAWRGRAAPRRPAAPVAGAPARPGRPDA